MSSESTAATFMKRERCAAFLVMKSGFSSEQVTREVGRAFLDVANACDSGLSKMLQSTSIEDAALMARAIEEATNDEAQSPTDEHSFQMRHIFSVSSAGGYVVADDDVDFVRFFWEGLVSGVVVKSAGGELWQAAGAALCTLMTRLFYARKKGARVVGREIRVLQILKSARDGLDEENLVRRLNRAWRGTKWTPAEVRSALESLGNVRLGDGTVRAFVARAADGRWSSAGV